MVELDQLVLDFYNWQQRTEDLVRENASLQKELKQFCKKSALDREAAQAKELEAAQLKSNVDKLHKALAQRCNFEEENQELKCQIKNMKNSAEELENAHSQQMADALDNLNTLTEAHKVEMASSLHAAQLKLREELDSKEKELEEKVNVLKTLKREKAELERKRHTDVVKLRIEYDTKLLKMQKQQTQPIPQPSSVTSDIFRKKLQHMKMESEKEITRWKRRAEELSRELQSTTKKIRLNNY